MWSAAGIAPIAVGQAPLLKPLDVLLCPHLLVGRAGDPCGVCGAGPCSTIAAFNKVAKPKRKSKGTSPTQRSLKHMRALGYLCAVVERWNPHARVKQDLYGFIDILCVKGEDIIGVQACSAGGSSGRGSDVSAHITKIVEHKNWPLVCAAIRVIVHGWRKNAAGRWVLREVEL